MTSDTFGREATAIWQRSGVDYANDAARVNWISTLVERGYEKKILLSHDHAGKFILHKWGGVGYDHLIVSSIPLMRRKGFSEDLIDQLVVKNPADILTIV